MGYEPSSQTLDGRMPDMWPLTPDALARANQPALNDIANWARDYLCCPHADLGRSGPVCPFVSGALQKQLLHGVVYAQHDLDVQAIKVIMLEEMERFIALRPTAGNEAQFKALLVLFPNTAPESIEAAQEQLAQHFVPNGLMAGEFHAGPPGKRGLWNDAFRPFYSPVPLLGIRHMVATDVLFLKDNPELFGEYVKIYGNAVPERFRAQFNDAAQRFGISTAATPAQSRGAPRIIDALADAALGYRVHCHEDCPYSIRTPRDFARWIGYELDRITKTLFVKSHEGDRFYLMVCSIGKRLDMHALARQLGVRRLELASLPELQHHVGYPPTSVTPLAVDGIPVFMDEDLMGHPSVLTGSGVPGVEIEIAPGDMQSLCGAQLLAMT